MKKQIVPMLLCLSVLLSMTGCGFEIEQPDLDTVAIHSLLWIRGASLQSDFDGPPIIELLDTDSYGRVLFSYRERSWGEKSFSSLLIMQKSADGYVFFYPDVNFYSVEASRYDVHTPTIFPEDQIELLKQKNDWEKEMDLSKCMKARIAARSECLESVADFHKDSEMKNLFLEATKAYNPTGELEWKFFKGMQDYYGRTIYHGWVGEMDVAILFDPDMGFDADTCYFIPNDFYNYQDELHTFKKLNHWNEPLN